MKQKALKIICVILIVFSGLFAFLSGACFVLSIIGGEPIVVFLTIYIYCAFFMAGCAVLLSKADKLPQKTDPTAAHSVSRTISDENTPINRTSMKMVAVTCESCGGVTNLPGNSTGICDYCDSPIHS